MKEDVIKLRDELDEVRLKAEERKSQQKDEKAQQDVIRNGQQLDHYQCKRRIYSVFIHVCGCVCVWGMLASCGQHGMLLVQPS